MTYIPLRCLAGSTSACLYLGLAASALAIPLDSASLRESTGGTVGDGYLTDEGASEGSEAASLGLAGPGRSLHGVAWTSDGNLGTGSAFVAASGIGADRSLFGWGSASAVITYQFAVEEIVPSCTTPPCPALYVPVVIQAHDAVTASGSGGIPDPFGPPGYSAGAGSHLYLSANGSTPVAFGSAVANSAQGTLADQFDFIDTIDVRVDWEHDLELQAFVNRSSSSEPGEGAASAFVDPIISLDPAHAANHRLVASEGVSVPEPSSVLLQAVGTLGLTRTARKRRRREGPPRA